MENQETFQMTYSAREQEEIQAIREKYLPKEENKMEQLRALDASVSRKATRISMILGIGGSLILGTGMSLIMTDFGNTLGILAFPAGVVLGLIGMGILALAYPVYRHTLKKLRKKAAPEILRLAEELSK